MTSKEIILANPVIAQSIEDYRNNLTKWYMDWFKTFKGIVANLDSYEPYVERMNYFRTAPDIKWFYKDKPEELAEAIERAGRTFAIYAFRDSLGFIRNAKTRDERAVNTHIINSRAYRMAPTFIKGEPRTLYMINKIVDEESEAAANKLVNVITKQTGDIKTFDVISYDHQPSQWCGIFLINNSVTMSVKLIWAGGYNIQCLHTRYIANIIKRNEK